MKKILSLAAVALLAFSGASHAATLDVFLGASPSYSNVGTTFSPNVPLPSPLLTLDNNAQVLPQGATLANYYSPLVGVSGNYLAVLGLNPALNSVDQGFATFHLNGNYDIFGLTWGTIDSYNLLTIKDATHTFIITGADILTHLAGTVIPGQTQANVQFIDPFGPIITAQLSSTNNTFEAGAFIASNNTPLPAALPMFGAALIGLFLFAWMSRRERAKA